MLLHPVDCQCFTKAFFFVIEKWMEMDGIGKIEQFPQTDRTLADSSGLCALCPFQTGNSLMEIETGIYKKQFCCQLSWWFRWMRQSATAQLNDQDN